MADEPGVDWTASFAEKLNHLFDVVRNPESGKPYSNEELARWCTRTTGHTMSRTFVWQLRTGQRTNPTLRNLNAMAGFFSVPLAYFEPGERSDRIAEQLRLARRLADARSESMVTRAANLSPESIRLLAGMIDRLAEADDLAHRTDGEPRSREESA